MRHTKLTLAALLLAAAPVVAEEVAPDMVKFDDAGAVEQSLTGVPGNPEEGAKVVSTKSIGNCVACHTIAQLPNVAFQGNVGPELSWTGENRTEAELRGILTNSKKTFDGTIMPAYYKTSGYVRPGEGFTKKPAAEPLPPLLTAQQIEDTIAFLMTLKDK